MKNFEFLLLLLFFSCDKKEKMPFKINAVETNSSNSINNTEEENPTLKAWISYYQIENPKFKSELFQLKETTPITYTKTSVPILNKKEFNEIYKPFLIFNESKDQYLDFDSYNWSVDKDGNAGFEADQQVVLVDLKKKKAQQIAFFGPSFWVEDAYWKGDSVAVLLGNSYDKIPFKTQYNFKKNRLKYYEYPDTLKFKIPYSKIRLRSKGIKVE